jgi:DNA-binding NarL/FixJ family response regulator
MPPTSKPQEGPTYGPNPPAAVSIKPSLSERHHILRKYEPKIGDERIASVAQLEQIIREELPGLAVRRDLGKNLEQAGRHLSLMEYFKRRSLVTASEIRDAARLLGIPLSNARKWLLEAVVPVVYRHAEEAVKSQQAAVRLRQRLGVFQSPDVVRKELRRTGMLLSNRSWASSEKQSGRIEVYYEFLELLKKGTLKHDIARKLNLRTGTIDAWLRGHLPWALFLLTNPTSERSRVLSLVYKVRTWHPRIGKTALTSSAHLARLIGEEYWGLEAISQYGALFDDADKHFQLLAWLGDRRTIRAWEIRKIASETGCSETTIRQWTIESGRPQIYVYLEKAIENRIKATKLRAALSIKSMADLKVRMQRLYLCQHLMQWCNYWAIDLQAEKYYQFLDMLERGYNQDSIAQLLGVGERTVYTWLQGTLPLLAHMLKAIPEGLPADGWAWLPLRIDGRVYTDYIEAPDTVRAYADLVRVVAQMVSRISRGVGDSAEQSDPDSDAVRLAYLLGLTVSDGYIDLRSKTSYSLRVLLSKSYEWAVNVVDKSRCDLEALGVDTYRHESPMLVELVSATSPFFVWFREALLGFSVEDMKTYTPIRTGWATDMPRSARVALLQGFADGDGYASPSAFQSGIAGTPNRYFIQSLLQSLGIRSGVCSTSVQVRRLTDLVKAAETPMFRHATGRQRNLEEVAEMARVRLVRRRTPLSREERSLILKLLAEGLSHNRIVLELWRRFRMVRGQSTVSRVAKGERQCERP